MAEHEEKKLHSERAAEEIRVGELVKVTQKEARDSARDPLRDIPVTNRNYWRFRGEDRRALPRSIKWGIAGLIALFVVGFVASYFAVKHEARASIASQAAALSAGVEDLQSMDPQGAAQEFSSLSASSPSGIIGALMSFFGAGGPIRSFADLSMRLTSLSNHLSQAESDVFTIIAPTAVSVTSTPPSGAPTGTFLGDLQNISSDLGAIDADAAVLSKDASSLGVSAFDGGSYLSLKAQIEGGERFLQAFIPWFSDASATHHVLVLFENPSEMRPGGGFLGSYADVSVNGGKVTNVAVHDIADVDVAFKKKIVPPVPLQLEETAWRPADANWFFDFPTSASETLALFNGSGLYAGSSTTFDGVVAITPQVLSDILAATGPVTVPGATSRSASTTFTADNLVDQIQSIVEAGQGKTGGNPAYPKKVLADLYQTILQQVSSSSGDERSEILQSAFSWAADKDLMVYFADPTMESFAENYEIAGDEYVLPQNFNGDYFALADTDINADKSERYIAQTVDYASTIGSDGTLTTHVIIDRTHQGNKSPYWWYRTTNTDYLQVFVPDGASLVNENGGIAKTVPAPINYVRNGYSTDPLLAAIVSSTVQNFTYPKLASRAEGDKDVYAVWARVAAGKTTQVVLDYTHRLFVPPAPGVQYQFVFERPSGATGEYKVEIDAPLGYVFAENDLASFMFDATSTPGRLTFTLTLQKLGDQKIK